MARRAEGLPLFATSRLKISGPMHSAHRIEVPEVRAAGWAASADAALRPFEGDGDEGSHTGRRATTAAAADGGDDDHVTAARLGVVAFGVGIAEVESRRDGVGVGTVGVRG